MEKERRTSALREKMKSSKRKGEEAQAQRMLSHQISSRRCRQSLSMNLKGTVSASPDSKGNLFVQMGIMRSKVHISDLELIDEAVITIPPCSVPAAERSEDVQGCHAFPEINLLGKTVDEAVANWTNIWMTLISPI